MQGWDAAGGGGALPAAGTGHGWQLAAKAAACGEHDCRAPGCRARLPVDRQSTVSEAAPDARAMIYGFQQLHAASWLHGNVKAWQQKLRRLVRTQQALRQPLVQCRAMQIESAPGAGQGSTPAHVENICGIPASAQRPAAFLRPWFLIKCCAETQCIGGSGLVFYLCPCSNAECTSTPDAAYGQPFAPMPRGHGGVMDISTAWQAGHVTQHQPPSWKGSGPVLLSVGTRSSLSFILCKQTQP